MNAPDKIYLHGYEFFERPVNSWSEKQTDGIRGHKAINVEYIRKDALLAWAKEQKKDCECVIREHPEDESLWCERDKYDELIDKLNSM